MTPTSGYMACATETSSDLNHCCPVKMAFRFLSWFLVLERGFLEVFKMNLSTFEQA